MKTFSFAEGIKTGSIKNNDEKSAGGSITPGIEKINQGASMKETEVKILWNKEIESSNKPASP